jgi:hypothetical protein
MSHKRKKIQAMPGNKEYLVTAIVNQMANADMGASLDYIEKSAAFPVIVVSHCRALLHVPMYNCLPGAFIDNLRKVTSQIFPLE